MRDTKKIVICLDGTWQNPYKIKQRSDGSRVLKPSNVLKLSRAVLPRNPDDGREQITYYDAGIGALVTYPGRPNRLLSFTDRILGGGWGAGFESNLEEAFRFLVHNHREGDQVFLFGFSRGAAQARALTRFLDWLGGVPQKRDAYFAPLFLLHYVLTRGTGRPKDVVTEDGHGASQPIVPVNVELLGVWDTVMALGSRLNADARTSTPQRSFYVGSSPALCVRHARQALAIDEERFDFRPEIWLDHADYQTMEQRWFPGSHSNVGGGYVHDGLANISFRWLIDVAAELSLAIDHDFIKPYRPYPQDRFYPSTHIGFKSLELIRFRLGKGRRKLTGFPDESRLSLDRSVIHRLKSRPQDHKRLRPYRPKNVIEYLATQNDLSGMLVELGFPGGSGDLPDDVFERIEHHRQKKGGADESA
jgi:uncharacterized protein (DUF2235 family)